MTELTVNFDTKALMRALDELPIKAQKRAKLKAVRAGGNVILKEMKANVPVRSGNLKKSLALRPPRSNMKSQTKAPLVIAARRPEGSHSHLVEFGSAHNQPKPYMRPAIAAKADEAIRAMGDAMGKAIEAEAAKLGGKR